MEFVQLATITRPHGVRGAVRVLCDPTHVELLRTLPEVRVDGRMLTVTRVRGTDNGPILEFDGIESREAADGLRSQSIEIARELLPPRGEDEYLVVDLEGLVAIDATTGKRFGMVTRVRLLPANDVLDVKLDSGGDVLVPFIRDAVITIDMHARTAVIDRGFLGEEA